VAGRHGRRLLNPQTACDASSSEAPSRRSRRPLRFAPGSVVSTWAQRSTARIGHCFRAALSMADIIAAAAQPQLRLFGPEVDDRAPRNDGRLTGTS
jgi:hypothetical protein